MNNRDAWLEINLSAIKHNIRNIKNRLPQGTKFCAVVKADGYGHGALHVAKAAIEEGADCLAVATTDEGIELRKAGFKCPILVLGVTSKNGIKDTIEYNLSPFVSSVIEASALATEAEKNGKEALIHLKVNTGMTRLGVEAQDAGITALAILHMQGAKLEGLCTHFAVSDSADFTYTNYQIKQFEIAESLVASVVKQCGKKMPLRHIANSAASIFHLETAKDMVRVGISLYGLCASSELAMPFVPEQAMSLKAKVVETRWIDEGTSVGYGRTFIAKRKTRVAVIPLGYADGVFRLLSNKGKVGFESGYAPMIGNVCMDQFMIDVTDLPDVNVGSVATIFGQGGLSATELASIIGTIDYEIICAVTKRVPRIYLEE